MVTRCDGCAAGTGGSGGVGGPGGAADVVSVANAPDGQVVSSIQNGVGGPGGPGGNGGPSSAGTGGVPQPLALSLGCQPPSRCWTMMLAVMLRERESMHVILMGCNQRPMSFCSVFQPSRAHARREHGLTGGAPGTGSGGAGGSGGSVDATAG